LRTPNQAVSCRGERTRSSIENSSGSDFISQWRIANACRMKKRGDRRSVAAPDGRSRAPVLPPRGTLLKVPACAVLPSP